MENKDLEALNSLIDDAIGKEVALEKQSEELALKSKAFADYLEQKKRQDAELAVLWDTVKQAMIDEELTEYETEQIKLKLSDSGKYKSDDIDLVPNEVCEIKKTLVNKKVKAYLEVHGELPDHVESTGYVLRKTIKKG